jgi:hypothetical protein
MSDSRVVVLTNPWQSGEIRGRQIASALASCGHVVVVDPGTVYADDTILSVKVMLPVDVVEHVHRVLMDVVDSGAALDWYRDKPKVELLAISKTAEALLRQELPEHTVWFVPEHHCNREGATVNIETPTVVGYCGTHEGLQLDVAQVERVAIDNGYRFVALFNASTRQQVVDFYRMVDVQLCWRKEQPYPELKNPLKLANAGSFGVPTIAWPEVSYVEECADEFMPAKTLDDVVCHLDALKRKTGRWCEWSHKALAMSRRYSLERVVSVYEEVLYGCNAVECAGATADSAREG